MKIVHLSYSDLFGGAARSAYNIHKSLVSIGINSKMIVVRKHPNKNELIFKKFIDDFDVNFPGRKLIIFGDDP